MRKVTPSHRIRRLIRNRDSKWHPNHDFYKWFVLANVMIGTFMAVLDATIVNVALPKMMASFGVGLDTIEWVLTAYMLAMAVMLPAAAWLADHFGYKRMYFLGILVFIYWFKPSNLAIAPPAPHGLHPYMLTDSPHKSGILQ